MIEKRYQVFISSTFRDLVTERQAVLSAVLQLDHMPAGMELFPATDDSAWDLIKDVIDSSDYYVLIIGGRYGSLGEEGLGYTEKEYDYAISKKKPVIAMLHRSPDQLPRASTEVDPSAWEKLVAFREKVERKHTCIYWQTAEELKASVIVSLINNFKRRPAVGWVRADIVPTDATIRDVLALRNRVAELETEIAAIRTDAPPGSEDLMQGDDLFKVSCTLLAGTEGHYSGHELRIVTTWNKLFSEVSPILINEASDIKLRNAINRHFERVARNTHQFEELNIRQFSVDNKDVDTCLIQFRALGLIRESDKKRSINDKSTYWTLTPFGDQMMIRLRALRRNSPARRVSGGESQIKPDIEEDAEQGKE